MLFNTADYLIFLPVIVILYYCIPTGWRYLWLLGASYYFYMQWNPAYVLLLLAVTVITFAGGLLLEKTESAGRRKACLVTVISVNLLLLGYFKYSGMLTGYLNRVVTWAGGGEIPWDHEIVLPVGISFFTLQAIGYLIDVYRKEIYAEHNFFRYALFISFFPQLVAGPIERSKNLLKQLAEKQKCSYENIRRGLLQVLYGLFLKMVIADRLAVFVDHVYSDTASYPGFYIVVATALFAIQIYCDFYGYSVIARGSALLMGIRLMDNFKAPFLSRDTNEFWRRWHISLSSWFRDYLYIPLGGNRKGEVRKYINLLFTFAMSGLWHGASMAFITWGLLNGIFQVTGQVVRRLLRKRGLLKEAKEKEVFSGKVLQTMITFLLFCFSVLFFRSNNMVDAWHNLCRLFSVNNWYVLFDHSLTELGISAEYFYVLAVSVLILFGVDRLKYREQDVTVLFFRQQLWFRILTVTVLTVMILLFGCYGSIYDVQQFIYFQF